MQIYELVQALSGQDISAVKKLDYMLFRSLNMMLHMSKPHTSYSCSYKYIGVHIYTLLDQNLISLGNIEESV